MPLGHGNPLGAAACHGIGVLRAEGWAGVPTGPGLYRWFFPQSVRNQISTPCGGFGSVQLLQCPHTYGCLYIGVASNLRERVKWHAEQALRQSALRSGALSTFRFTLLALTGFPYDAAGERSLNVLMDQLHMQWWEMDKPQAEGIESAELCGCRDHYPLNIDKNHCAAVRAFVGYLSARRSGYKRRYVVSP